jgi:hypothetical protein
LASLLPTNRRPFFSLNPPLLLPLPLLAATTTGFIIATDH